jgi:hypothetical protein
MGPDGAGLSSALSMSEGQEAIDLTPLNRSTLYVRVGPKGGLHATSSSYRRTAPRQAA